MTKKEKRIWTAVIVGCIVLLTALANRENILRLFDKKVTVTKFERKIEDLDIDTGYSKDGKNRYIVELGSEILVGCSDDICYVLPEFKGKIRNVGWTGEKVGEVEYWLPDEMKVNFYAYGSDKLEKTIDITEVVNGPDFPCYITRYSSNPVWYQGEWCLAMRGYRKTEKEVDLLEEEKEYLYLNLKTMELYVWDWDFTKTDGTEEMQEELRRMRWKLDFVSNSEILENNGFEDLWCIKDYMYDGDEVRYYVFSRLEGKNLPPKGAKLYENFPGVEKYQGQEEYDVYFIMFDIPTNEEFLNYFLDEVSFEGLMLDAEDSIDGQWHEINSIDDYYMYRYGVHEWDEMPEDFGVRKADK